MNARDLDMDVTGTAATMVNGKHTPGHSPARMGVHYERQFVVGKRTMARKDDSLYHVGKIIKVNYKTEKCFIRFEDCSEYWCTFADVRDTRKLSEDITCCLCNSGVSKKPNEIVLCDRCGLGYHQKCHNPNMGPAFLKLGIDWFCSLCWNGEVSKSAKNSQLRSPPKGDVVPKTFPYEIRSLHWDNHGTYNVEKCYCYCGKDGEWYFKMLQCHRCHQWFHEDCLQCLTQPLLIGDRFYVFVCSVCNSGTEFIQRIELSWTDIAHLALFHLTVEQNTKYYDLNEVIIPWLTEHWTILQPGKLVNTPELSGVELERAMTTDKEGGRFKSGHEIKKRHSLWGLRERLPPLPPKIHIPAHGPVTKETVGAALAKVAGKKVKWQDIVRSMPVAPIRHCFTKKRKASLEGPDSMPPQKKRKLKKHSLIKATSANSDSDHLGSSSNQDYGGYCGHTHSYHVTDLAPGAAAAAETGAGQGVPARGVATQVPASPAKIRLDHIIPRPTSFDGCNHPFKTVLERDQEIAHTKLKERILSTLATTTNGLAMDGDDGCLEAGESEGASEGPGPESDPSPQLLSPLDSDSAPGSNKSESSVTSDAADVPRIRRRRRGRPSKAEMASLQARADAARRLGIKDPRYILQQSQRRALGGPGRPPKSGGPGGAGAGSAGGGETARASRGRGRTRNVVDKTTLDGMSRQQVSLHQLKSSVNTYFGAASRLAHGEGFRVLARRVTPEGKVQYLVEWEGGIIS